MARGMPDNAAATNPIADAKAPVSSMTFCRYRQIVKRWFFYGVLGCACMIGLRVWWGYEAHRRIAAEIAAIHARGEPVLVEDFTPSPPPPANGDAQDAVELYQQAASRNPLATA